MNHFPRCHGNRFTFSLLLFLLATSVGPISSVAAIQSDQELKNPGFEDAEANGTPENWRCGRVEGLVFKADESDAHEGERSLLVDTTKAKLDKSNFVAVSQSIAPENYRGKKVRFRAFVKTADLTPGAQAQLWMRVDRENKQMGAFDNMQNRPILVEDWKPFEIVLKIDDDAKNIIVGAIVVGNCKVQVDTTSIEVVDDDTETTEALKNANGSSTSANSKKNAAPQMPSISPRLLRAREEAENAPKQPFFNHWLWIPFVAFVLFGLSALPNKEVEVLTRGDKSTESVSGGVAKFAFRFSFAYWLLYNWSFLLRSIIPVYGFKVDMWYQQIMASTAQWVATNVMGIEDELVPGLRNGSGDTTEAYLITLIFFVLAIAAAFIWTIADSWRRTDYRILKDLLRSYLRYVLAFWMLSYGLAKVGLYGNQFSPISEYQFNKYWGDSSPMNVVWSFMGASQAYTVFAGMGEVIGGLLLVWRRTAVLGALVVLGVMTNVMMLNYCYDVPVKLFSTHLVCMALFILLYDVRRLANLLFLNRTVEPATLLPPYTNNITIWIQRLLKTAILIIAVAMPIYRHASTQWGYYQQQCSLPEYFGQYEIVEYKLSGKVIDQSESDRGWRSVRFCLDIDFGSEGLVLAEKMIIGMNKVRGRLSATLAVSDDPTVLVVTNSSGGLLPNEEIRVTEMGNETIQISGETSAGLLEVKLKRNDNIYRVSGRGYRWINEIPFNR